MEGGCWMGGGLRVSAITGNRDAVGTIATEGMSAGCFVVVLASTAGVGADGRAVVCRGNEGERVASIASGCIRSLIGSTKVFKEWINPTACL